MNFSGVGLRYICWQVSSYIPLTSAVRMWAMTNVFLANASAATEHSQEGGGGEAVLPGL